MLAVPAAAAAVAAAGGAAPATPPATPPALPLAAANAAATGSKADDPAAAATLSSGDGRIATAGGAPAGDGKTGVLGGVADGPAAGTPAPAAGGAFGAGGEADANAIAPAVDGVAAKLDGRGRWAGWGVGTGECRLAEWTRVPRRGVMGAVAVLTLELRFDADDPEADFWDQSSKTCRREGIRRGGAGRRGEGRGDISCA